jgi:hypothetical protein
LELGTALRGLQARHPKAYRRASRFVKFVIFLWFTRLVLEICVFIGLIGPDDWEKWPLFIRWLPFVGHASAGDLLAGIGGIVIGILVALLIEAAAIRDVEILKNSAENIERRVTEMVFDRLAVQALDSYSKVNDAIYGQKGVIKHALSKGNDLFIMNPTAWFGYWLSFDTDILLHRDESRGRSGLNSVSHRDIYGLWKDKTTERQSKMRDLADLSRIRHANGDSAKLRYITLDYRVDSKHEYFDPYEPFEAEFWEDSSLIPYIREFAGWGLQKVKVYESMRACAADSLGPAIMEHSGKQLLVSFPERFVEVDQHDLTNVFKGNIPLLIQTPKARLAQHLLCQQYRDIRALDTNGVKVKPRPEIPFQLYLSRPPDSPADDKEWQAVVVFSDKFNIGTSKSVAAFATRDREIADTFFTIFDQLWASTEISL